MGDAVFCGCPHCCFFFPLPHDGPDDPDPPMSVDMNPVEAVPLDLIGFPPISSLMDGSLIVYVFEFVSIMMRNIVNPQ